MKASDETFSLPTTPIDLQQRRKWQRQYQQSARRGDRVNYPSIAKTRTILTTTDIPTILSFIQTTASLQDPSLHVKANEDSLLQTIHFSDLSEPSPSRVAYCLLLVAPEGRPAGFAIYFKTYSTWRAQAGLCLEDIFVADEYRGRGYGRLLMEATAREARALDCGKLEWMCYRDNDAALRFYGGLGAERLEELVVLKVAGEKLERLAGGQRGQREV